MLLNKIKLVGFKSFVDATPILFPSALVGIVGPNGCGKSNVIDAVRWVMGESAASRLRGEQGTDVIFNGSSGRQPLAQASVELVFDNQDASLGGEYAQYSEISVRRVITREGVSSYYLNGTRCRRKDIADIFLGTGLGPRSYAIIQQGMVTRLIEAKPEELRLLLEEAAGISKYKERRKETETRIRSARENLARLQDVRIELDKQLASLTRQAEAAEKFKSLKEEHRQTKSFLLALRCKELQEKIRLHQAHISEEETTLASLMADIRHIEAELEKTRLGHTQAIDFFNERQTIFYRHQSELSKVEQEIKHQAERREELLKDLVQTEEQWHILSMNRDKDKQDAEALRMMRESIVPQARMLESKSEAAHHALLEFEEALSISQQAWQTLRDKMSLLQKTAEVEQAHIQQYEARITNIQHKIQKLEHSLTDIHLDNYQATISLLKEEEIAERHRVEEIQTSLSHGKHAIESLQSEIQASTSRLDILKQQRQQCEGKKVSLEVLQAAALLSHDDKAQAWLSEQDLLNCPRLAQQLQVEAGWERAVETVLGDLLHSVCIDADAFLHRVKALNHLKTSTLSIVMNHSLSASAHHAGKLVDKIQSAYVPAIAAQVWAAETLEEALVLQGTLQAHESVITKDGLWLSRDWVRVAYEQNSKTGVLEREKTLKALKIERENIEVALEQQEATHAALLQNLQHQHGLQEELQQHYQLVASTLSRKEADLSIQSRLLEESLTRQESVKEAIAENYSEISELKMTLASSRAAWSEALEGLSQLESQQAALEQEKEEKWHAVQSARFHDQAMKKELHEITVKMNVTDVELRTLEKNIEQLKTQLTIIETRKDHLHEVLSTHHDPLTSLEEQKETWAIACLEAEQALTHARNAMHQAEESVRSLEKEWREKEQVLTATQLKIQGVRLELEGLDVRQQTLKEQLQELQQNLEDLLNALPENKTVLDLEQSVAQIERRIERLGPINLVAIEECQEKEKLKSYYDAQNMDLEAALSALEEAMQKIDKETRSKFKETFEAVNHSFTALFPKIFGGGRASLDLTESDLLEAGVEITAQPPGKKNSSLHLLSGGEKTMVALALVFSIFQLNPAPFCMLDEVDAPLDDSNVVRFSELVREMSQKVQFIVITHNKVTMEMMHQLMGVTMNEPGVSRIVSVDIKEAVELVE